MNDGRNTAERIMEVSRGSILVVEDEPENIRFLGQLLAGQGYQVHVADSGERALEALDSILAGTRLDLVLLDILMPGGMDGIETCSRLKSRQDMRNVPVIFLTGKDDSETMVRAFDSGGADYLLKPFDIKVLLARVKTHLELGYLSRNLESALAKRTRELQDANARLRRLAMDISLVSEREKNRLAGELHDSPMQKLALAQVQVASAARSRDAESDRQLEAGLDLMREALQELRTLQFDLSPPVLYREGLVPALRWLAAHTTQRFGLEVVFAETAPVPALDREPVLLVFQCARELVCNMVKHAGASRGWLELGSDGSVLTLTVSDNGRGFDPDAVDPQATGAGGYGLFNTRERLALWDGGLSIESGRNGTRVSVQIPLAHWHEAAAEAAGQSCNTGIPDREE
jgi:signal transduction histidine kinase